MKKLFLSTVLLILGFSLHSQDISGTWVGFFSSQTKTFPDNYYFFLEIKQKGKTIWGTYTTSDSMNNRSFSCLGSLSGTLSKKTLSTFDLYKERLEDFDKNSATYAFCNLVNRLSLHYFIKDKIEYLTGQWYTESEQRLLPGGAAGSFALQHINSQTMHDVDQYFPKLSKLIKKGTSEEGIVLKADESSAASPTESKLLDAIRFLIEKKAP